MKRNGYALVDNSSATDYSADDFSNLDIDRHDITADSPEHSVMPCENDSSFPKFPPPPTRVVTDVIVRNHSKHKNEEEGLCKKHLYSLICGTVSLITILIILLLFLIPSEADLFPTDIQQMTLYVDQTKVSANYTQIFQVQNHNWWTILISEPEFAVNFQDTTIGTLQPYTDKVNVHRRSKKDWTTFVDIDSHDNNVINGIFSECMGSGSFQVDYVGTYKQKWWAASRKRRLSRALAVSCS